ncbi:MAG: hypothetical protein JWO86_8205, partial [Myxococcaceae bacterium]|nr:hypothetical protein [Myxococcaceae bacterium]
MFALPPPPHVCGAKQLPQSRRAPQPFATCPQFAPASAQVRGVHGGAPQTPFTHGLPGGHAHVLT